MKKDNIILICLFILSIIISIPLNHSCENYENKKHQEYIQKTKFEIKIIDKYETIGSKYYLVGGRVPEQEYHIVYKVIPLTENAEKVLAESFYGSERDEEIQYKSYRKVQIGQKYTTNYPYINFN